MLAPRTSLIAQQVKAHQPDSFAFNLSVKTVAFCSRMETIASNLIHARLYLSEYDVDNLVMPLLQVSVLLATAILVSISAYCDKRDREAVEELEAQRFVRVGYCDDMKSD